MKNKNILLDIVQIEECKNLPQMFERIARSAYEMWSWMQIPSGNDTKEQSEVECIKMRFANEDIENSWMRIPKSRNIKIDMEYT